MSKRKKDKKYSLNVLMEAVENVREKKMNSYQASERYGIPRSTIIHRLYGTRGAKQPTPGRPPELSIEWESKVAAYLHEMEKCDYPLTSKEVKQLICSYIQRNGIVTRFKNDYPGKEWFRGFKRRHKLSLKKPQSVEIARKKACNPFTVYNYFNLLERVTQELDLVNKPHQIYNLDETSFCSDPTKTKVVGLTGFPSTRTTGSPGRNNTTVLLASNAVGKKIPPLIIFQGKQLWSEWFFENETVKTAYAVSRKGWMETKIFENYIKNVFIPAIGEERPVLLIYDGHSTHVDLSVIELLMANQVTVLKLPAHSSHILQPLDCSTMKPMKDNWDSELVKWQRLHVGAKLPKQEFARIITMVWDYLNPVILQNGFRKSGIYPLNRDKIPKEKFDKLSWSRWEEHIRQQNEQSLSFANNNAEEGRKVESCGQEDNRQNKNEVLTLKSMCTSMLLKILNRETSKEVYLPKLVKDPKTFILSKNTNANSNSGSCNVKILSNVELTSTEYKKKEDERVSFEELLLKTISRNDIPKTSRKRVSQEAEILTYKEALDRMKKKKEEKEKAEETKRLNKLKRANNKKNKKKSEKKKQKKQNVKISKNKKRKELESDSESDCSYTSMNSSDDEDVDTYFKNILSQESFDDDLQEPLPSQLPSTSKERQENIPKLKSEKVNKTQKQTSRQKEKAVNISQKTTVLGESFEKKLQEQIEPETKIHKIKREQENKRKKQISEQKDDSVNLSQKTIILGENFQEELQEPLEHETKIHKIINGERANERKKQISKQEDNEANYWEQEEQENNFLQMKKEKVNKRKNDNDTVEILRRKENDMPQSSEVNEDLNEGDFVLAAFQSIKGKRTYKYVCHIDQINQGKIVVTGLKSKRNNREFKFVENDISIIEKKDVISLLPDAVINEQRDTVIFPYKVEIFECK